MADRAPISVTVDDELRQAMLARAVRHAFSTPLTWVLAAFPLLMCVVFVVVVRPPLVPALVVLALGAVAGVADIARSTRRRFGAVYREGAVLTTTWEPGGLRVTRPDGDQLMAVGSVRASERHDAVTVLRRTPPPDLLIASVLVSDDDLRRLAASAPAAPRVDVEQVEVTPEVRRRLARANVGLGFTTGRLRILVAVALLIIIGSIGALPRTVSLAVAGMLVAGVLVVAAVNLAAYRRVLPDGSRIAAALTDDGLWVDLPNGATTTAYGAVEDVAVGKHSTSYRVNGSWQVIPTGLVDAADLRVRAGLDPGPGRQSPSVDSEGE